MSFLSHSFGFINTEEHFGNVKTSCVMQPLNICSLVRRTMTVGNDKPVFPLSQVRLFMHLLMVQINVCVTVAIFQTGCIYSYYLRE